MKKGLFAGILWALGTVLLSCALTIVRSQDDQSVFLWAPFICAFLHDLFSTVWMVVYLIFSGEYKGFVSGLASKGGKCILLASILGEPIGMTGYILAMRYMGASYAAIISGFYPVLGAVLSVVFLKEKMNCWQIAGLVSCVLGIIFMGGMPEKNSAYNMPLGILFGIICCVGWALETVICAYGLKKKEVTTGQSIVIRQGASALLFGVVLFPLMRQSGLQIEVFRDSATIIVAIAALSSAVSLYFFYSTISAIGASKSMMLNITYCAWTIPFSWLILAEVPSFKNLLCCLFIIGGASASDLYTVYKK